MKNSVTILFLLICSILTGQSQTIRVLFLGNSYTYVNDLPKMIADVANSMGNTLIFDSNTLPGYSLKNHYSNRKSRRKIAAGNWDYIVLQEQSLLPSLQISQVQKDVFPYAHTLDSIINIYNPCGETVFFMTWGRKDGDTSACTSWPPVCTYSGMDSLLNLRYRIMAERNNALLAPVGAVWNYIRQNFPLINLYLEDGGHPSVEGSYAAACTFYTIIFRKDPTFISFNSRLKATDASNIKAAVKLIVYDSLMNWHIGEYDPIASFTYLDSGTSQIIYTNSSKNATTYTWYFGDGGTSSSVNPTHKYLNTGPYTIKLIAKRCSIQVTIIQTIAVK